MDFSVFRPYRAGPTKKLLLGNRQRSAFLRFGACFDASKAETIISEAQEIHTKQKSEKQTNNPKFYSSIAKATTRSR